MPDILKQQGIFPVETSVRIPDVVFEHRREPEPIEPPVSEGVFLEDEFSEEEFTEYAEEAQPEQQQEIPPAPVLMSREEIEALHAAELEEIRQDERQKAYSDALREKRGEFAGCLTKVDAALAEMQDKQREYMERWAKEVKYIAVDIAEKMVLTKIDENDLLLTNLVMQMVSNVKNATWLNVEVSERLVSLVEFLKTELAKPDYQGKANVTPLSCMDDTCRVSTPEGTTVATISVQAQNLKEIFREAE